jgi:inorganic pyrophosphatase
MTPFKDEAAAVSGLTMHSLPSRVPELPGKLPSTKCAEISFCATFKAIPHLCLQYKEAAIGVVFATLIEVNLYDLDPGPECPETVRLIVEIPKNSPNKYEYDAALGLFRMDRSLYSPLHYPGDYGFIPGTLAEDNDPMDVLALVSEPSFTGCAMEVRPVGILNMEDNDEGDQKILAVPKRDPRFDQIHTMDQIFPHVRREVEHFFTIYKELEGRTTLLKGWGGPAEARKAIQESRQRYLDARAPAL